MKQVDEATKQAWESGDFVTDDRRPMARVTIQKMHINLFDYRYRRSDSVDWHHDGKFASALFGQKSRPRELRNVKSVKWTRGVEQDVGTCTIQLYNVQGSATVPNDEEYDFPGWFTPNRGEDPFFAEWGYEKNRWNRWILPDRLIRTYEGYGFDSTYPAETDPHMYPSGVWLVDTVSIDTEGLITVECRDLGRLLLDHICFPPVVPWDIYPLWFDTFQSKKKKKHEPATHWQLPKYDTDSNMLFVGLGITDNGHPIVSANGTVAGHHGTNAFDGEVSTHWLSTGTRAEQVSDFRWIQAKIPGGGSVEGVRVDMYGGALRCYVSLMNTDGEWLGRNEIPYTQQDGEVDVQAGIPYVDSFPVGAGRADSLTFDKKYHNIKKIRFTFNNLWNSGIGYNYPYRVAVQSLSYASDMNAEAGENLNWFGNYNDYTHVVKWLCAWGGFYWPRLTSGEAYWSFSDGTTFTNPPDWDDVAIKKGRVFGDLHRSFVAGVVKLDVDFFDKKPLMDGIAAVRDIIGFEFHIDELGGVVWRMPNVWKKGNWVMPENGGERTSRTQEIVTIDEDTTLLQMTSQLSSKNVRERVFIGNLTGHKGAVVRGYNPAPSGQRRVGGWTDQRFATKQECEMMADLIALRQQWVYRQNTVTIPGNPQIQIDDQVRIKERMTGEGYLHRVMGISSTFDNEDGKWTYDLQTHWLGTDAFEKDAWHPERLTDVTRHYLHALGVLG